MESRIPNPAEIRTSVDNIFNSSFRFGQSLAKTISPTPVLAQSPEIKEAKLKIPCMYSFVSKMDDAQLGIKPIIDVKTGWSRESFKRRDASFENPITSRRKFNAKVKRKI